MTKVLTVLALALAACTSVEDMIVVSGPAAFVREAGRAPERCGVPTVRVEVTGEVGRMVGGSDVEQQQLRCLDAWVFAHAVKGTEMTVTSGGPM